MKLVSLLVGSRPVLSSVLVLLLATTVLSKRAAPSKPVAVAVKTQSTPIDSLFTISGGILKFLLPACTGTSVAPVPMQTKPLSNLTGVEAYATCLFLNTDCICTHYAMGVTPGGPVAQCLYTTADVTTCGVSECDPAASCQSLIPAGISTTCSILLKTYVSAVVPALCTVLNESVGEEECGTPGGVPGETTCQVDATVAHGASAGKCRPNGPATSPPDAFSPQTVSGKCFEKITGQTARANACGVLVNVGDALVCNS